MKGIVIALFLASVIIAVQCNEAFGECSVEQSFRCFQDCKAKGHHSACEFGACSCTGCYYRACKRKCARDGKIAQCQEDYCACLD